MVESSDWDLLTAWRAGEADAGDRLVARYFQSVSRFFRSKLGDDVDDVIQQTFLACVEGRDKIRGPSFRSYLFGVARICLFEAFRKKNRGLALTDLSERSVADLGTTPTQSLARDDLRERTRQALTQLSVDDQIALQLCYWEEMNAAEVASVLGVPPGTVRSRLSRARGLLKNSMKTTS